MTFSVFSRTTRLLALLAPGWALLAGPAAGESPAESTDREWAELESIAAERFADADQVPLDVYYRWSDGNAARYAEKALPFIEHHGSDPRRWRALLQMIERGRSFYRPYPAGGEPAAGASDTDRLTALNRTIDQAAATAWRNRLKPLIDSMASAADVPVEILAQFDAHQIRPKLYRSKWGDLERRKALAEINAHLAKFPASPFAVSLVSTMLSRVERNLPDQWEATLTEFTQSANPEIRAMAEAKRRASVLRREPLELKFTALDGREVEFAQLRGKVILLDFWATWCGPCKAELPNVKAVYDQYHARGFEVIAVSLDRKSDRQKLEAFVREHQLPWPQHFVLAADGRNVLAEQLGITTIPAPYLFDQGGPPRRNRRPRAKTRKRSQTAPEDLIVVIDRYCLLPRAVDAAPMNVALTRAEVKVLTFLCAGYSNKEIARFLNKAEPTVKHQVSVCLRKFGVSTRYRLMAVLR